MPWYWSMARATGAVALLLPAGGEYGKLAGVGVRKGLASYLSLVLFNVAPLIVEERGCNCCLEYHGR